MSSGMFPMAKDTVNNQYYLAYNSNDNNWNIMLYKFDADLNSVPIDTATYNYDSLCPDLPIVSDTIYVTGCNVITGMVEYPSPKAYFEAKQKVNLTAYPNPATAGRVDFKLKYTRYHQNMQLAVYDMAGHRLLARPVATGQKELSLNISALSPGMYVAVVSNGRKTLGKAVFAVR